MKEIKEVQPEEVLEVPELKRETYKEKFGKKEINVTVVKFQEYTSYDFEDLSTFFFKDAIGNRHYIHTSKREEAQYVADQFTGVPAKYKVIATREQKTKSRLESGGLSCYGTATRKGQKKYN